MRILVTGSRELTNKLLVWNELSRFAPARPITVVCGYDEETELPKGADEFAFMWVNAMLEKRGPGAVIGEYHKADWERKCDENCWHPPRFKPVDTNEGTVLVPYCPVAGNLRNAEMVESGADICLAFYKIGAKNRGTRDCARRAHSAGIKVKKFWER